MEQVVFTGARTLELRSTATPEPKENQALLRTLISGVSAGTERMWYDGSAPALKSGRKSYPYTPGYELVGEVEIGSDVLGLKKGDRVFAMKPHASHAVIGEKDIWFKLPDDFPIREAVFTALTGTAVHAIHRSGITLGDRCAVVGMGTMGFMMIQILSKAMGCDVVAVTTREEKAKLARNLGAADVVDTCKLLADEVKSPLVHCAFDCSGASAGVGAALKAIRNQGVVVGAGFYTEPFAVDGETFFSREAKIVSVRATGAADTGNEYNRWDRAENMKLAAKLVFNHTVSGADLITHSIRPADLNDMYENITFSGWDYIQVIIDWTV